MKLLSKNIFLLRTRNNLTQAEIADALGFKRTTWNNYESGVSTPSLEGVFKISKYFGVGVEDFVLNDLTNVNLIDKNKEDKNHEKVNLNVNATVNPKGEKQRKYILEHGLEVSFKDSLNEDQAPYNSLKHQLLDLSNKMATIEANIDKRLSKMEGKIKALEKGNPKM